MYVIRTSKKHSRDWYGTLLEELEFRHIASVSFHDDSVLFDLQSALKADKRNLYLHFDKIKRVNIRQEYEPGLSKTTPLSTGSLTFHIDSNQRLKLRLYGDNDITALTGLLEYYGVPVVFKGRQYLLNAQTKAWMEQITNWTGLLIIVMIMIPAFAIGMWGAMVFIQNKTLKWAAFIIFILSIVGFTWIAIEPFWSYIVERKYVSGLKKRLDAVLNSNKEEETCES